MNISKFNEMVEAWLNNSYLGMCGIENFNRDKTKIFQYLINNMLKRTMGMFEYKNLPETLSAISIEKYLQGSGTCLVIHATKEMIGNAEAKPGLYALPCKAGGRLDANYVPTLAVVSNAWLDLNKSDFDLLKNEAVYMWNDSLREGFAGMYSLYASELTDNILTLHFQEVHNRILSIVKATTEDEKKDAEDFFKSYEDGKFAALMSEEFIETLKNNRVDPFKGSANSSIKETLEARQWLLAHWNIEVGLNDNYNMKRESLNENEIEANADTLTTLLDDMFKCRKRDIDKINELWCGKVEGFDKPIEVDFSSSWKRVHDREKNAQKVEEAETKIIEKQADQPAPKEAPKEDIEPKAEGVKE